MPSNYYDDGDMPDKEAGRNESPEQSEERRDSEQTTLIPSSLCPGMDVGDTIELEIVGVHEDEYETRYKKPVRDTNSKTSDTPSMEKASESNRMSSYYD